MKKFLPDSFVFSPVITLISIALAVAMVFASNWQWQRYKFKTALVETYESNSEVSALPFPIEGTTPVDFEKVLHHKVELRGRFDYERQVLIMNRKHATGPGFWLLAPFEISGSERRVMVSRGFIPFREDKEEDWQKYSFYPNEEVNLLAVAQPTVPHRVLLSAGTRASEKNPDWIQKWLYPDIEKISKQYPYQITTPIFLQQLGGPPSGLFPAESVSVRVPPSTHFGYAIEWLLLALSSLGIGFLLQAFPRKRRKRRSAPRQSPEQETRMAPNSGRLHAIIFILSAFAMVNPDSAFATERPSEVPEKAKIVERLGQTVDIETHFIDQHGKKVSLSDLILEARPTILVPVYYHCPRMCPATLGGIIATMNKLDLTLGKDYNVITFSFDSREDFNLADQRAKEYQQQLRAELHSEKNNWHFLTGSKESISKLLSQLGFHIQQDGEDFIHAAVSIVLTPEGVISRYLYGFSHREKDAKLALLEAADGKIGSTFDRVLLYCFRFDPSKGKYTASIMNITRIVSLLGAFLLGGALVTLRIREVKNS